MESKSEMLARHAREIEQSKERHARELAEMESRWWEEWFTEDPCQKWESIRLEERRWREWFKTVLPTIIRKREKIGVTVCLGENSGEYYIVFSGVMEYVKSEIGEKLAGRTLAPGEKVEI